MLRKQLIVDHRSLKQGEIVFVTGRVRNFDGIEEQLQVSRTINGYSDRVPEYLVKNLDQAYDIENTLIEVGDEIVRVNTTDNLGNLERRTVIAVTKDAAMMAPKSVGGRPTASSNFNQIMVVKKHK